MGDLVKGLKKLREAAGISPYVLARRAGMYRMRLQLAEGRHVSLRAEEIETINQALRGLVGRKLVILQNTLSASEPLATGEPVTDAI